VGRFGAAAKASKAKNGGWWLLRDALARFLPFYQSLWNL